ncbi:GlcG/HbpS family heme-binding protein [Flavobacterium sp. P21]|uniref:GlcG/HbpS family heme-binding protein n=1 Tax=Flavobacterium sp. P21 TaxID=3423948 RepID=UPI003D6672FE
MDISSKLAFTAMENAANKATEMNVPVNIAVLDTAGFLKYFMRMDDAYVGSIDIALGKAKTAMLFRKPSHELGDAFLRPEARSYGMENTNGGLVGFKGGEFLFERIMK